MAKSLILIKEGRVVVSGNIEAEAFVSPTPISFFGVDTDTGNIIEEGHPLKGKTIAGKVLVYPAAKGSSGDCMRLWRCLKNEVGPAAIILGVADPVHVQGGIITNIPFIIANDANIVNKIKSGDVIRIENEHIIISDNSHYNIEDE